MDENEDNGLNKTYEFNFESKKSFEINAGSTKDDENTDSVNTSLDAPGQPDEGHTFSLPSGLGEDFNFGDKASSEQQKDQREDEGKKKKKKKKLPKGFEMPTGPFNIPSELTYKADIDMEGGEYPNAGNDGFRFPLKEESNFNFGQSNPVVDIPTNRDGTGADNAVDSNSEKIKVQPFHPLSSSLKELHDQGLQEVGFNLSLPSDEKRACKSGDFLLKETTKVYFRESFLCNISALPEYNMFNPDRNMMNVVIVEQLGNFCSICVSSISDLHGATQVFFFHSCGNYLVTYVRFRRFAPSIWLIEGTEFAVLKSNESNYQSSTSGRGSSILTYRCEFKHSFSTEKYLMRGTNDAQTEQQKELIKLFGMEYHSVNTNFGFRHPIGVDGIWKGRGVYVGVGEMRDFILFIDQFIHMTRVFSDEEITTFLYCAVYKKDPKNYLKIVKRNRTISFSPKNAAHFTKEYQFFAAHLLWLSAQDDCILSEISNDVLLYGILPFCCEIDVFLCASTNFHDIFVSLRCDRFNNKKNHFRVLHRLKRKLNNDDSSVENELPKKEISIQKGIFAQIIQYFNTELSHDRQENIDLMILTFLSRLYRFDERISNWGNLLIMWDIKKETEDEWETSKDLEKQPPIFVPRIDCIQNVNEFFSRVFARENSELMNIDGKGAIIMEALRCLSLFSLYFNTFSNQVNIEVDKPTFNEHLVELVGKLYPNKDLMIERYFLNFVENYLFLMAKRNDFSSVLSTTLEQIMRMDSSHSGNNKRVLRIMDSFHRTMQEICRTSDLESEEDEETLMKKAFPRDMCVKFLKRLYEMYHTNSLDNKFDDEGEINRFYSIIRCFVSLHSFDLFEGSGIGTYFLPLEQNKRFVGKMEVNFSTLYEMFLWTKTVVEQEGCLSIQIIPEILSFFSLFIESAHDTIMEGQSWRKSFRLKDRRTTRMIPEGNKTVGWNASLQLLKVFRKLIETYFSSNVIETVVKIPIQMSVIEFSQFVGKWILFDFSFATHYKELLSIYECIHSLLNPEEKMEESVFLISTFFSRMWHVGLENVAKFSVGLMNEDYRILVEMIFNIFSRMFLLVKDESVPFTKYFEDSSFPWRASILRNFSGCAKEKHQLLEKSKVVPINVPDDFESMGKDFDELDELNLIKQNYIYLIHIQRYLGAVEHEEGARYLVGNMVRLINLCSIVLRHFGSSLALEFLESFEGIDNTSSLIVDVCFMQVLLLFGRFGDCGLITEKFFAIHRDVTIALVSNACECVRNKELWHFFVFSKEFIHAFFKVFDLCLIHVKLSDLKLAKVNPSQFVVNCLGGLEKMAVFCQRVAVCLNPTEDMPIASMSKTLLNCTLVIANLVEDIEKDGTQKSTDVGDTESDQTYEFDEVVDRIGELIDNLLDFYWKEMCDYKDLLKLFEKKILMRPLLTISSLIYFQKYRFIYEDSHWNLAGINDVNGKVHNVHDLLLCTVKNLEIMIGDGSVSISFSNSKDTFQFQTLETDFQKNVSDLIGYLCWNACYILEKGFVVPMSCLESLLILVRLGVGENLQLSMPKVRENGTTMLKLVIPHDLSGIVRILCNRLSVMRVGDSRLAQISKDLIMLYSSRISFGDRLLSILETVTNRQESMREMDPRYRDDYSVSEVPSFLKSLASLSEEHDEFVVAVSKSFIKVLSTAIPKRGVFVESKVVIKSKDIKFLEACTKEFVKILSKRENRMKQNDNEGAEIGFGEDSGFNWDVDFPTLDLNSDLSMNEEKEKEESKSSGNQSDVFFFN